MVYVAWIKLDCPSKAVIKVVLYTAPFVKLVLYIHSQHEAFIKLVLIRDRM